MKTAIILGSAPDAVRASSFDLTKVNALIALNNAWQIRHDWTHAIHPEDFPSQRRPAPTSHQKLITHETYVPANNAFGGIIYAGATMAFTTAYWALHEIKPDMMLFCGCDMIYDQKGKSSHFYGHGNADPLRHDPTLQSLEAKANRLMLIAAENNCLCANLSDLPTSRLTFPKVDALNLDIACRADEVRGLALVSERTDVALMAKAKQAEKSAALFHESGDYWNSNLAIDPQALREIDNFWHGAIGDQSDVVIV